MALSSRDHYDALLNELNEERAAALMRISKKLEELIDRLRGVREQLPSLAAHQRDHAVREYEQLREEAKKYRWYLEVQREAVGLRNHRSLDEFYAVPDQLPMPNSQLPTNPD